MDDLTQYQGNVTPYEEDEIDILNLLVTVWKYKVMILSIVFISTVGSAFIALQRPKQYEATASFLPQSGNSKASGFGNLLGLAAFAGINIPSASSGSIDHILLMNSRLFVKKVIQRLVEDPEFTDKMFLGFSKETLQQKPSIYNRVVQSIKLIISTNNAPSNVDPEIAEEFLLSKSIESLKNQLTIKRDSGKNLISIKVLWEDRKIAALVANTYLDELKDYLKSDYVTASKKGVLFIEAQEKRSKKKMAKSEEQIRAFSERYGFINVRDQASMLTSTVGTLKSQIALEEVNLIVLQKFQGEGSREVSYSKTRLEALQRQIDHLSDGVDLQQAKFEIRKNNLSLKDMPTLGLEFSRLNREFAIQQEIYKMLRTQLERVKIEEIQEKDSIITLERAVPQENPSYPNNRIFVMIAFMGSLMFSLVIVFFIEFISKLKTGRHRHNITVKN